MNPQTYDENPEVVEALSKIIPVQKDANVLPNVVRMSFDVRVDKAEQAAKALTKQVDRLNSSAGWDWRSGTPNPNLSGPPKDK